jgi:hypothetical protein
VVQTHYLKLQNVKNEVIMPYVFNEHFATILTFGAAMEAESVGHLHSEYGNFKKNVLL